LYDTLIIERFLIYEETYRMLIAHDGHIHTPEARGKQISTILELNPDAAIVGSVARAAILGYDMPTLKEGLYVRDVDVVDRGVATINLSGEDSITPFPVDIILDGLITIAGGVANIKYRMDRPDVSIELPADIFDLYKVMTPRGVIQTLHPDTLLNIHRIIGTYNPRVCRNLIEFRNGLRNVSYNKIPPKVFDPLSELQSMALKDPDLRSQKLVEQIMALYDYFTPALVRKSLKPIANIALKCAGVESRNGTVMTK
jgi:hypothetical protein